LNRVHPGEQDGQRLGLTEQKQLGVIALIQASQPNPRFRLQQEDGRKQTLRFAQLP
jgi:hypothetical protein